MSKKLRCYEGWTLSALKTELKTRGAKLSGRKEELIERLEAYDRNENFGNSVPAAATWTMTVPDPVMYKDITSNTCIPLTSDATVSYLEAHEVLLGEKSKNLYKERFLRFAKSCEEDNHVFVKLQCRAEMKKSVTYDLDIKLSTEGDIVACQCDCTAGMGPSAHCKHVRTALYGLLQFAVHKTPLIVELSCTDRLQKFHWRRIVHSTSPVKSQDLGILQDASNVLFDPMEDIADENDAAYNARVRSIFINDCINRREHVPLMQMFTPANPYALDLDHDYLRKRQSDLFLDHENVTSISEEIIGEVEQSTRGQAKNPRWKLERLKRIQSSNFGKVAKATNKSDKDKLALDLMSSRDLSHVAAISHGIKHEDIAIRQYEQVMSTKVRRLGLIVAKDRPYLGTSVDGMSGDIVVEVKCPFNSREKKIDHVTVPYLRNTPGGLQLNEKHDYYYQIQGQMHITGKNMCHLLVYTYKDFKVIEVPRNDPFISDMLQNLDAFFCNHYKRVFLDKHFYKNFYDYIWDGYM